MVLNCGSLEKWRTVKNEDSIKKDSQKWWCPHHVHPKGLFIGLYMPNPPSKHNAWKANKDQKKEE